MESALANTTVPATFVSHARSRYVLKPKYALLRIHNVKDREAARNYINNAVYFAWENKDGERNELRGVIKELHGTKGVVKAIFERNMNPRAVGQTVYVKLYKLDDASL